MLNGRLSADVGRFQYVQDDTPVAETRYRGRFPINPNALPMAVGNQFLLVRGYSGSGTTMPMLKVELKCATAARYSNGRSFAYTYDSTGNRLRVLPLLVGDRSVNSAA